MRDWLGYQLAVLGEGWVPTWTFIRRHLVPEGLITFATVIATGMWLLHEGEDPIAAVLKGIAIGLIVLGLMFVAIYLFNNFLAPVVVTPVNAGFFAGNTIRHRVRNTTHV